LSSGQLDGAHASDVNAVSAIDRLGPRGCMRNCGGATRPRCAGCLRPGPPTIDFGAHL